MIKREYTERRNGIPVKMVEKVCDGCGMTRQVTIYSILRGRKVRGSEVDFCDKCSRIHKHVRNGKTHGNFKHGLSSSGYRRVVADGVRRYEHIVVAEQELRRPIQHGESVHHIDFVKTNNLPENLFVFSGEVEHQMAHNSAILSALRFLNVGFWFDRTRKEYVFHKTETEDVGFDASKLIAVQGARYVSKSGKRNREYIVIKDKRDPKTNIRLFHVFLMECYLGRKLYIDEIVHHVDGVATNNVLSNLVLMTKREHRRCHNSLLQCASKMIRAGKIVFDRMDRKYHVLGCG